jgi:hypothetical protein
MRIVLCVVLVISQASFAYADGLKSLIEVGKSQNEIQKALEKEDRAYDEVSEAISDGSLREGTPKEEIADDFGEPVVKISARGERPERWVYKPSSSTFFEGKKIYLYFGQNAGLIKYEVIK